MGRNTCLVWISGHTSQRPHIWKTGGASHHTHPAEWSTPGLVISTIPSHGKQGPQATPPPESNIPSGKETPNDIWTTTMVELGVGQPAVVRCSPVRSTQIFRLHTRSPTALWGRSRDILIYWGLCEVMDDDLISIWFNSSVITQYSF